MTLRHRSKILRTIGGPGSREPLHKSSERIRPLPSVAKVPYFMALLWHE